MKVLLWIVCCVTAVIASVCFRLNKQVHYLRGQNIALQSKIEKAQQNEELLKHYETALNTLKKEDPTIVGRWDLLINGIVASKEKRPLNNRGSEDDDDLEIYSASGVKR